MSFDSPISMLPKKLRIKQLAIVIMFLAVTLGVSIRVHACTCAELTVAQQRDNASAIFRGKVISKVKSDAVEKNGVKVTLGVDTVWKGRDVKEIVVYTGATEDLYPFLSLCATPFVIGEEYLVFAYGSEHLATDVCAGTTALSNAGYLLRELGAGIPVRQARVSSTKERGNGPSTSFSRRQPPTWIVDRLRVQSAQSESVVKPSDPASPVVLNAISFANNSNGWVAGDRGVLARSRDGGLNWTPVKISPSANFMGIFFYDRRLGWAVGNEEGAGLVMRTDDEGDSWTIAARLRTFQSTALHSVRFVDERRGWVSGEIQHDGLSQGIILATDDGGHNWNPQYFGVGGTGIYALKFLDSQRGWAVGHNVILRTEDGGKHWFEQLYRDKSFFGVEFLNARDGWVVGGSGTLLHTTNGGETWVSKQLPPKYNDLWLSSVRFVSSMRGWIAGDNGVILATSDGGDSWELESAGGSNFLRGLTVAGESVFAVGNEGAILRRQLDSAGAYNRKPHH